MKGLPPQLIVYTSYIAKKILLLYKNLKQTLKPKGNKMIAAIKLIIDLFKTKEINRRNLFDDFIEPLFIEFESITANYLELFETDSEEELMKIRNMYIQAREKVNILQEIYGEDNDDDDVKNFLNSIHLFFFSIEQPTELMSIGRNYIEVMISSGVKDNFKNQLKQKTKDQQLKAWSNAVKFYGILKSKYKRPIRL